MPISIALIDIKQEIKRDFSRFFSSSQSVDIQSLTPPPRLGAFSPCVNDGKCYVYTNEWRFLGEGRDFLKKVIFGWLNGYEELKSRKFDLVVEASGSERALQICGDLVRNGGRLALFGWQHGMRAVNMTRWHIGGLKVLNTAPAIATDRNLNTMERAVRLIERGVFDLKPLVTHRYSWRDVSRALDEACRRGADGTHYVKGVLIFE